MKEGKRIQAVLLLAAISVAAASQGTIVTGIVKDNRDVPVTGVTVCQVNTTNCTASDMNGIFHLLLEPGKDMNLKAECLGFSPVEVVINESTSLPVTITLKPAWISDDMFSNESYKNSSRASSVRSTLGVDVVLSDFSMFEPELGTHNTEVMDYFSVVGPELGASLSGISFGLGCGFGYSYKDDYDTLIVDLNNTQWKLNLGYDLISSYRLRATPFVSFRWLRYRLQNYPGERKISLAEYLSEKDIDLRFNQTIAVAGLNLEYIIYSGAPVGSDFWSIGLTGGYALKLNRSPWVFSKGNRIITGNEIGLKHLTFGLSVSFYTNIR